jgi:hypothetical protein
MSPKARSVQTIFRPIGQSAISFPHSKSVDPVRYRALLLGRLQVGRFRQIHRESQCRRADAESPQAPVPSRSFPKCIGYCGASKSVGLSQMRQPRGAASAVVIDSNPKTQRQRSTGPRMLTGTHPPIPPLSAKRFSSTLSSPMAAPTELRSPGPSARFCAFPPATIQPMLGSIAPPLDIHPVTFIVC